MKKKSPKTGSDLQTRLPAGIFQTEKQAQEFAESLLRLMEFYPPGEPLAETQIQADDLVAQAYELAPATARTKLKKALKLDPENIEAHQLMAWLVPDPEKAAVWYARGIAIGRRVFGGKYLKENKGSFWGLIETRPYMRCLQGYADVLYGLGKVNEAVQVLEEMIELNPNDNQGVRDQLLLALIQLNENDKFTRYERAYRDDFSAFALFTRALFYFKTKGDTIRARQMLEKAKDQNKFVVPQILSEKFKPEFPEMYTFGGKDEAAYYTAYAYPVWHQTPGAVEWLRKHTPSGASGGRSTPGKGRDNL